MFIQISDVFTSGKVPEILLFLGRLAGIGFFVFAVIFAIYRRIRGKGLSVPRILLLAAYGLATWLIMTLINYFIYFKPGVLGYSVKLNPLLFIAILLYFIGRDKIFCAEHSRDNEKTVKEE